MPATPWPHTSQTKDCSLILFLKSSLHLSTPSWSPVHNCYLRKRRKWPLSPYKTQWHLTFAHQQAMQNLKQSVKSSKTHLLNSLIDSFAMYECEPFPKAYHFVIKVLANNPSRWDQIPQVLDHIQKVETFETPEFILIDLIKFYGDSNRIQGAIELFYRIPNFRCNPSVHSLKALLLVLCEKGVLEIIPQVLIKAQLMNIRIEESCFGILIRALCRIGKVNYAAELLNHMANDGFNLDGRIFSYILKAMGEQKECSGAEIMCFLEEMCKLGFSPNRGDWYDVIQFLAKKENATDAIKALRRMKLDCIDPDIVCYNLILDRLVLEEDYVNADKVFDELLVLGLVPNVFTYNSFINGLCKQNKVEEGIKMLRCMEELGCRPDLVTYSTILPSLVADGKLNLARELMSKMEMKGMQLNSVTYELVIRGLLTNSEFEQAFDLLQEMINKFSVSDSVLLFDKIICGLCQNGMLNQAFEVLRKMSEKNVGPGVESWEALLQVFEFIHSPNEISAIIE